MHSGGLKKQISAEVGRGEGITLYVRAAEEKLFLQVFTSMVKGAARPVGMGTPGRCPWEGMGVRGAGLNYLTLISKVRSGFDPVPLRKVQEISRSTGWGADAYLLRRSRLPAVLLSCCGRSSSRGACTAACAWSCRPTAAPRCWAGRASQSRGPGGCVSSVPRPRRSCPANAKPAVTSHRPSARWQGKGLGGTPVSPAPGLRPHCYHCGRGRDPSSSTSLVFSSQIAPSFGINTQGLLGDDLTPLAQHPQNIPALTSGSGGC